MSIAIVALLLLVPVVIIGIVLLAVITRSAASRNPNRPEGEGDETGGGEGSRSGADRE